MKKRDVIIFSLAVIAIFVSLYFDVKIVQGVSMIRNVILDKILLGITFISSVIILFFILTSMFLWKENKRRWIIPLWLTLAISGIVSFLLKISIQRPRPYELGLVSVLPILQEATQDFSFPSGHAIFAFCAVPILSKEFPKLKYVWIAFACMIAFSRVYFGVHFLSDVIAGGLLGIIIGSLIVKAETEYEFGRKISERFFDRIKSRIKKRK